MTPTTTTSLVVSVRVDVVVIVVVARFVGIVFQRHVDALDVARWVVAEVLPLQEQVDFPERRPLGLVALPALVHQVSDLSRTLERRRQTDADAAASRGSVLGLVELGQVRDDPLVGERLVRLLARERQDLPERDAEAPDVALRRELALQTKNDDVSRSRKMTLVAKMTFASEADSSKF